MDLCHLIPQMELIGFQHIQLRESWQLIQVDVLQLILHQLIPTWAGNETLMDVMNPHG